MVNYIVIGGIAALLLVGVVIVTIWSLQKVKFSKLIVTAVVLLNVGFTAAVLYTFLRVESEPTALIGCWFAFTTGELWLLSGITREKVRRDADSGDQSPV
jgi:uncharacterized protein with PQ loop repeat